MLSDMQTLPAIVLLCSPKKGLLYYKFHKCLHWDLSEDRFPDIGPPGPIQHTTAQLCFTFLCPFSNLTQFKCTIWGWQRSEQGAPKMASIPVSTNSLIPPTNKTCVFCGWFTGKLQNLSEISWFAWVFWFVLVGFVLCWLRASHHWRNVSPQLWWAVLAREKWAAFTQELFQDRLLI